MANGPARGQPGGAHPPSAGLAVRSSTTRTALFCRNWSGCSTSVTAVAAASACATRFPRCSMRSTNRTPMELDGVPKRSLLGRRRSLLPLRHVLHVQVSLRAAARVERRFPAPDAARQGRQALPRQQGAPLPTRFLTNTDRVGSLAGIPVVSDSGQRRLNRSEHGRGHCSKRPSASPQGRTGAEAYHSKSLRRRAACAIRAAAKVTPVNGTDAAG